jgi:hypothetical protein
MIQVSLAAAASGGFLASIENDGGDRTDLTVDP